MAKTNSGLLAYAKAQVGRPYWYGTYGQTATASLYESKKKQYPSYYTDSDFSSQYGQRVHDCVGIIKGYLWSTSATATPVYSSSQDKSASGMYAAATTKGVISTFPKTDGLLVFKGTSTSKITHVGVYDDEGYVYEAKGHSYGVVKTAYKQSDWNYWAQCPYCTDDTTSNSSSNSASSTKAAATSTADPKTTWTYLLGKIGDAYGVAGLMGNLYAESALIANNLQNSYQSKLGYTDATYTAAVDDGSYTKFSSDSAGYGLAQWTYSTRKANLKSYADSQNASIGNLSMQLAFLYKELSESYSSVLTTLKNATSVKEASDAVLTKFERPADQSDSVKTKRAEYGQKYYDTYASTSTTASSSTSTSTSSSTKTSTSTKFKAGDKVTLKNTALYASATTSSKSGTKSGTYYIWSAEVSNGRVRITNSSSNVGKSGQVTGFVNESDISATTTSSSLSSTTTSKKPTYTVGKTYTLQKEVNVRKGAGTGYAKVGYSGLSTDGKKHDADKDGALDKGTVVTCQKVTNVGNDVWIKCPSGWLAAYYNGDVYIK